MRYVNGKVLIMLSLPLMLAQSACSLSRENGHHVVISLPEGGFKASASMARVMTSPSPSPSPTSGSSSFPLPTSLADFKCFGVMVTGEGIYPQAGLDNCTANPDIAPGKMGMFVGLVPASGGTIDVMIPGGSARLIQLVGVQTAGDCPDISTIIAESGTSTEPSVKLGEPFAIGSVTTDVYADQSVEIKAAFDPVTAQPLFGCGNHNGGYNGGSIAFSNLDLFPHGATSSSMVRVVGNATGGISQIGLFSDSTCSTQISSGQWNYNGDLFSVQGNVSPSQSSIFVKASNFSGESACTPVPGGYNYVSSAPRISVFNPYSGMQITGGTSSLSISGDCSPYGYSYGTIEFKVGATSLGTCSCYAGTNQFSCSVAVDGLADGPFVLTSIITDTASFTTSDDAIFLIKDSLAPNLTIDAPSDNNGPVQVIGAAAATFSPYGSCGAPGYYVEVGVEIGGYETPLTSLFCNAGYWSGTLDLSGFPDGMLHIRFSLSGVNGTNHQTYRYLGVDKMANAPAPSVSSLSVTSGPVTGGTYLNVYGSNFVQGASVTIGGDSCTSAYVNSSNNLYCYTPYAPGNAAGTYSVIVTNPDAQYSNSNVSFTYLNPPSIVSISPANGSFLGGTTISIYGADFEQGASVFIGGYVCGAVTWNSQSSITCTTQAGSPGSYNVQVNNPGGQSSTGGATFTYDP